MQSRDYDDCLVYRDAAFLFENHNLIKTAATTTVKMPRAKECLATATPVSFSTKNVISNVPAKPAPACDNL
jgi:hypothetical protein